MWLTKIRPDAELVLLGPELVQIGRFPLQVIVGVAQQEQVTGRADGVLRAADDPEKNGLTRSGITASIRVRLPLRGAEVIVFLR